MGSGAKKKTGSGEVRCVAGTQSGVRGHCANHSFRVFFSGERFLPHDQSASPRFRAKRARPLSFVKAGSGNETETSG